MNNPSTCPHFSFCSGCELADPYNPPIWQEAARFFRENGLEAPLIVDGFGQTRIRAKLAIRPGPKIGLFQKGTHQVSAIPHCLVHHPSINEAALLLNKEMLLQKMVPYSEGSQSGTLRYAQFFVDRGTGKVQLSLVTTGRIDSFCERLLKYDLWHSIWQNIHPEPTNAIFGPTWERYYGEPFLWQRLNEHVYPFHPAAFSQTHLPLFEKMLSKIDSWVQPHDRIIELYAGVGVIGHSVAHKAKRLTLVENNPSSHLSFQQMKTDIPYLCIDAKQADLSGYDLTIVDPPRKGLDLELIPKIESSRLIYVSCQFSSFKRDAEILLSLGWKLEEAQGYLLFPGSNHVEILALFERRSV